MKIEEEDCVLVALKKKQKREGQRVKRRSSFSKNERGIERNEVRKLKKKKRMKRRINKCN